MQVISLIVVHSTQSGIFWGTIAQENCWSTIWKDMTFVKKKGKNYFHFFFTKAINWYIYYSHGQFRKTTKYWKSHQQLHNQQKNVKKCPIVILKDNPLQNISCKGYNEYSGLCIISRELKKWMNMLPFWWTNNTLQGTTLY